MKASHVIKLIIITQHMNWEFQATLKRKSHRQRFYSSMNYDEYCEVYGPPSPLFKPQDDPVEDIPLFDLESSLVFESDSGKPAVAFALEPLKIQTIPEIDESENFTQNLQRSPKVEQFSTNCKSRDFLNGGETEAPKRVRVRMRSQSDNSEYLIFNFLERISAKGRKRLKLE